MAALAASMAPRIGVSVRVTARVGIGVWVVCTLEVVRITESGPKVAIGLCRGGLEPNCLRIRVRFNLKVF